MIADPFNSLGSHPLQLPDGLSFFEFEGRRIFSVSGVSGGACNFAMCYVVEKMPTEYCDLGRDGLHEYSGGRWYGVQLGANDGPNVFRGKIQKAIEVLQTK